MVIIGGGALYSSIAYLPPGSASVGRDVVLLERPTLASGGTGRFDGHAYDEDRLWPTST